MTLKSASFGETTKSLGLVRLHSEFVRHQHQTISQMFVLSILAGVVLVYILFRDVRINAKY